MSWTRIEVNGILAEWLKQDGRQDIIDAGHVSLDDADVAALEIKCKKNHPKYTSEMTHAWAVMCIVGRQQYRADFGRSGTDRRWLLTWRIAIVVLLLAEVVISLHGAF